MMILAVLGLFHAHINKLTFFPYVSVLLMFVLFAWTWVINFKSTDTAFWSPAAHWQFKDSVRAYTLIKDNQVEDYNIADLSSYNTNASVMKYLLKRDNIVINTDYYHNKHLFVIKASNTGVYDTLSYEVAFFKPSKVIKTWKINDYYNLYLLERTVQ
jgi:hypothetical protein